MLSFINDGIVGHTYLNPAKMVENALGKKIPVSQNGKSGMYLSRFDVHLK